MSRKNGIEWNMSSLISGIVSYNKKVTQAIEMYANTVAQRLEGDAKEQAKWTDRTGRARQSLNGYVEKSKSSYRICLAHGVDYGLWLELAHEKRYAIVEPIIRINAPYVVKDFEKLLKNIT